MTALKTPNIVDVHYAHQGTSVSTNELGMREMQARVYEWRDSQYLLVKAPPASGKSRALMFVALDKLYNQGLHKVIVAVPERSIGASFGNTDLTSHGFFANWEIEDRNNLCTPGGSASKVQAFIDFLDGPDTTLVCTHATLRFAFDQLSPERFNDLLIAIDEFHHVSADLENSRLGKVLTEVMAQSSVHIVAMTGSYFRGDSVPVLSPEDEAKFTPVTYNYYDQLNGYQHLRSLGIGHHFYNGRYTDAIHEVLDLDKKTIIHIPSVNSGESTKDKLEEVATIFDAIGDYQGTEEGSGIHLLRRRDTGETVRVADLVDDTDTKARAATLHYLSTVAAKERQGVDIIIALGMAKEGFDWPFAEHALTVGYRASLTEIIQIIGRVTRDSAGKEHAQFTNLLAEPDADRDDVTVAVNNMLKAITASLLMEQVLAPSFAFKAKKNNEEVPEGTLTIKGFKEPSSERVKQIVTNDLNDLKAAILQDSDFAKAAALNLDPERSNKVLIPKVIRERYPDLSNAEVEEVRQHALADAVLKPTQVKEVGGKQFIRTASSFVNIEELSVDLIDTINPFQQAFEVLSKSVDRRTLKVISDALSQRKIEVSDQEALEAFPDLRAWVRVHGKAPNPSSKDYTERRLAAVQMHLQRMKQDRARRKAAEGASGTESGAQA